MNSDLMIKGFNVAHEGDFAEAEAHKHVHQAIHQIRAAD